MPASQKLKKDLLLKIGKLKTGFGCLAKEKMNIQHIINKMLRNIIFRLAEPAFFG